jgi:exonuclease III
MGKAFSVASWNVKHFKNDSGQIQKITSFLKKQDPDVFALYEVTGKEVFGEMTKQFPQYTFQITEGSQTQQILVGVRHSFTSFITQRVEFKAGTNLMRPGQLVTITQDGINYVLLFLHLASSAVPRGMGLRDDMFQKAVKFRKYLDKAAGGKNKSHYIFLGDLNVMGMDYPYDKDIEPEIELRKWDDCARRYYGMHRLDKTYEMTWFGGSHCSFKPANLDHVYAAQHLQFKPFKNKDGVTASVDVRGWVNETSDSGKDEWIQNYSDHSLLLFEIQKVE